jgi:hypothetical protein
MVRSEGNMSLKNPVTPQGIDAGTIRLVAQRLNPYATPGPTKLIIGGQNVEVAGGGGGGGAVVNAYVT